MLLSKSTLSFVACTYPTLPSFHALVFGKCISSACLVFFFQCSLTAWSMINAGTQLESFSRNINRTVETKMAAIYLCSADAVTPGREGLYIQISLN